MENNDKMYPLYGGMRACRRRCMMGAMPEGKDEGCTDNCTSARSPLTGYPLAMVYSPEQGFDDLYEPEEGLSRGTVFVALDLPFEGDTGRCR